MRTASHRLYGSHGPVAVVNVIVTTTGAGAITTRHTRYLHHDHLGSVDAITRETGALVERLSYDAWGKRRQSNGLDATASLTPATTHHGYTGHEHLDNLNLIHMNARVYDPNIGRFTSADPIGFEGGLDVYGYAGGNPLRYFDPNGLWSTEAHNYFLGEMFKGLPNSYIRHMFDGSRAADSAVFQLGPFSYIHAMSSTSLNPVESARKMELFVDIQMDRFKRYWSLGWQAIGFNDGTTAAEYFASAYKSLGMALHPSMDSTSPAHKSFQEWNLGDYKYHGSWSTSLEDLNTAQIPAYREDTLGAMKGSLQGHGIDVIFKNAGHDLPLLIPDSN